VSEKNVCENQNRARNIISVDSENFFFTLLTSIIFRFPPSLWDSRRVNDYVSVLKRTNVEGSAVWGVCTVQTLTPDGWFDSALRIVFVHTVAGINIYIYIYIYILEK